MNVGARPDKLCRARPQSGLLNDSGQMEVGMYDMKNLGKLKALEAAAPEAIKAFWAFDKAAMAPGAIPGKYKELMALAVAFTTQCPYCIEIHAAKAREAGASAEEIAETVAVAAALRAGAAITHGTHAMKQE